MTLLVVFSAFSQNDHTVEMADKFRADGKIYVVVAVLLLILVSLFVYLFFIEKRIKSLEKKIKRDKKINS